MNEASQGQFLQYSFLRIFPLDPSICEQHIQCTKERQRQITAINTPIPKGVVMDWKHRVFIGVKHVSLDS